LFLGDTQNYTRAYKVDYIKRHSTNLLLQIRASTDSEFRVKYEYLPFGVTVVFICPIKNTRKIYFSVNFCICYDNFIRGVEFMQEKVKSLANKWAKSGVL